MNLILKVKMASCFAFLVFSIMMISGNVFSQENQLSIHNRDTVLSVAHEYIETVRYCALITVDSTGQPHARTMDSFFPDENMIVYLGTNRNSRKVQEISNNPRVTLYYADDSGVGYVSIMGTAILVDDPGEKVVWWKEEWEEYYPDGKESYLLIKVVPDKLEIVNYQSNIISSKVTWEAPFVEFNVAEPNSY